MVQVKPELCPFPIPVSKRSCNNHACPVSWITGEWSDCTSNCGSGLQTRILKCVREEADGRSFTVQNDACDGLKRPEDTQICIGNKVCTNRPLLTVVPVSSGQSVNGQTTLNGKGREKKPQERVRPSQKDKNSLIVSSPDTIYTQDSPLKRLSIKIGGKGIVFEGTNLKIRCPRKKSAMDNQLFPVTWYKDNRPIRYSHLVGLTAKQSLRIKRIRSSDAGVYTCSVGDSSASTVISVKSDPGLSLSINPGQSNRHSNGNRGQTRPTVPRQRGQRVGKVTSSESETNRLPSIPVRSNDWFKFLNGSESDLNNLNPMNPSKVRPKDHFLDNKFVSDESQSGEFVHYDFL